MKKFLITTFCIFASLLTFSQSLEYESDWFNEKSNKENSEYCHRPGRPPFPPPPPHPAPLNMPIGLVLGLTILGVTYKIHQNINKM